MDMRHWKDDAGNVQVVWNPDRDAEYSPRGDEVDGPRPPGGSEPSDRGSGGRGEVSPRGRGQAAEAVTWTNECGSR